MTMSPPSLSLDGIRVLDLSRVLAGPFCGMLLSDLGADVIKIEDTASGDESRTWPPHKDGESAAFLVINRNKRDMTLDLKAPEGVAILKKMVATADVLIENFRTGTMESFGLGYDALSQINPRLVYASVSAYRSTIISFMPPNSVASMRCTRSSSIGARKRSAHSANLISISSAV